MKKFISIILFLFILSMGLASALSTVGKVIEIDKSETTIIGVMCKIPECEGVYSSGKFSDYGCPVFVCPMNASINCALLDCPIGHTAVWIGKYDNNNCKIYQCEILMEPKLNNATDSNATPELSCMAPSCEKGIKPIFTGKLSENGCKIFECPPSLGCKIPDCPAYMKTGKFDNYNCPIYECHPTLDNATRTCSEPICSGKQVRSGKFDKYGCEYVYCEAEEDHTCLAPLCLGAYPSGEYWSDGCPKYKCPIDSGMTACEMPICKENEKPFSTGEFTKEGCEIYKCFEQACPEECICSPSEITCPTIKPMVIEISTKEGLKKFTIDKSGDQIKIIDEEYSVKVLDKMKVKEEKLYLDTPVGDREVKVMPKVASETAIAQLKLKDYQIELKDVGKPIYEISGKRNVKILGIFKAEMKVKTTIDAATGEIDKTETPWWDAIAVDSDE